MRMGNIRENSEYVQHKFHKIAVILSDIVPFTWSAIVLGIFLTGVENTPHIQLWAKHKNNGQYDNLMKSQWENEAFLESTDHIQDLCADLHQHCCKGHDNWREFSFALLPDGHFTADFQYESISDVSSYMVAEWKSRFLL